MIIALKAGAAYAAVTFAIKFLMGTIRVLGVAPLIGKTSAIVVELPIMLVASWAVCGRIVHTLSIRPVAYVRAAMGTAAFVLVMLAELCLSVIAFGRSASEHWATYGTPNGLLGLGGQIAFALVPLIRMRWESTAE